MTCASRKCAEAASSADVISVLIKLVAQTNRNSASLSVVKTILKIILNLCRVSYIHKTTTLLHKDNLSGKKIPKLSAKGIWNISPYLLPMSTFAVTFELYCT